MLNSDSSARYEDAAERDYGRTRGTGSGIVPAVRLLGLAQGMVG